MAEPTAMPSLEIPEISSSSYEPKIVKAEIPSFDIPTFDLPSFEMETEP